MDLRRGMGSLELDQQTNNLCQYSTAEDTFNSSIQMKTILIRSIRKQVREAII